MVSRALMSHPAGHQHPPRKRSLNLIMAPPDRLPMLIVALVASIAACLYFLLRERDGRQRSPFLYRPLGANFPLYVGIGAAIVYCLRQPLIPVCIMAVPLALVHAVRRLSPEQRRRLHCWFVDGPLTCFVRALAKLIWNARWTWVPALTVAGIHGPIYLAAKGITLWYESFIIPIFVIFHDPQVGVFAIAAFTTWRMLERKAWRYWRRLRAAAWWECLFVGRRLALNAIGRIPGLRSFLRDIARLWRMVEVEIAARGGVGAARLGQQQVGGRDGSVP